MEEDISLDAHSNILEGKTPDEQCNGSYSDKKLRGESEDSFDKPNEQTTETNNGTRRKKNVPFWRLYQYATCLDVFMIVVGAVMAIAAGLATPIHILLIGNIINQFVFHNTVTSNNLQIQVDALPANESCDSYRSRYTGTLLLDQLHMNLTGGEGATATTSYFCSSNSSLENDVNIHLLEYLCDPDGTLRREIGLFSLYYVALATGVLIAVFLSTTLWNLSAFHQIQKMRKALYQSILHQDIGWFDTVETGDLGSRLVNDVENIQSGIGDKVAIFLQHFTTFISGSVVGFVYNWKLALVVYTVLPVISVLGVVLTKVIATFTHHEQEAYAEAGGIAEEVLSSIRTVMAFGGEEKEAERYGEKLKCTTNEGFRKHFLSHLIVGGLYFVVYSTYTVSTWYGSVLILSCEVSAGDVIIVLVTVINSSFALGNALPKLEAIAVAIGSATAVFDIIDKKPVIDSRSAEGETPGHLDGDIEFNDVVFAYPSRPDVQILIGLDIKIKAGQTVALVGSSGCGKSTVLQLLQRFYNPLGGIITIDGQDISSYNLKWLRIHISVVSQEPVLFNTSIAENIRHGCHEASMDDIIEAAENSNAHEFISKLPDGYDTLVGQRGAQLSGGQKQRIAIARALVRKPKILILDEATSALDNQSEKVVQEALDKARKGRTTIVVAHRLSTIQTADIIVAIANGHVVEIGNHGELMKRKGLYYDLVTAQTIEEEEKEEQNLPLARFRAAVNKSMEARRQILTKFQAAVKESMAAARLKRRNSRRSIRRQENRGSRHSASRRPPSLTRQFSHRSSQLSITLPATDVFSSQTSYLSDYTIDAIEEDNEGEEGEKEAKVDSKTSPSFVEFLKLNKSDWPFVLIGVIFSALTGCIFPVMSILLSRTLWIYGLSDAQVLQQEIVKVAGAYFAAAVTIFLFYFIANSSLSLAGERLTKRLRGLSFKAMLRQEMAWFDMKANSTGALLARLSSDASAVKGATGILFGSILQAFCSLAVGTTIAFVSSWELALVMMFAFLVHILSNYFQMGILAGRVQENKKKLEDSVNTVTESIDNINTVASLGLESYFYSKYSKLLKGPLRSNIKSVLVQAFMSGIGQSLIFYIYSASFSLSAFLVIAGRANYEVVFRVFSVVYYTASSISQASSITPDVSKSKASAARILSLLKRKPRLNLSAGDDGKTLDEVVGSISAKSIHFSYPSRPKVKVLQGLNVDVKPGQTLALVGPSGCGKSTLISLVERFYDPNSGSVTLEGVNLKDLDLSWLRRQIGLVPQEPVLFDMNIAKNIRYGALYRPVSDKEVIEAAKAANIHNFVESLPLGYATNVGSKGTQLSGGQKQRIAIARALVRNPKFLLLDEATSALDTESEKVVQEALDKAREGRTSIVIAHRLSTIYNSDVIAVIHEGQVIESGTHSELMELKEAYYHLNTVQQRE